MGQGGSEIEVERKELVKADDLEDTLNPRLHPAEDEAVTRVFVGVGDHQEESGVHVDDIAHLQNNLPVTGGDGFLDYLFELVLAALVNPPFDNDSEDAVSVLFLNVHGEPPSS